MNDPMEGFYRPSRVIKGKRDYKRIVKSITDAKTNIGIACLSETYDNILMWAHYAGNYTGVCFDYSTDVLINGLPSDVHIVRLAYADTPPLLLAGHATDATDAAVRILSQKQHNWAYEREWRMLGPVGAMNYGSQQALRRIFFGSRINTDHKAAILDAIRGTSIEAYMMDIDGYEHYWEPVGASPPTSRSKTPPTRRSKTKIK